MRKQYVFIYAQPVYGGSDLRRCNLRAGINTHLFSTPLPERVMEARMSEGDM